MAKSGMFYVPEGKGKAVCKPGEFRFSVIGLDHGHIYGMTTGLVNAGAELVSVYDPDPAKVEKFRKTFAQAAAARSEAEVLGDKNIQLIATACVTSDRGAMGLKAQDAGKHFFTDKAPFTTHAQLEAARKKVKATGLKWAVYFSERLQNECSVMAGELVKAGEIGKVIQVLGLGPHRLGAPERPAWFFKREKFGGILCDIGSHQIEQFLFYADVKDAKVTQASVANMGNPEYPEFEDFGDATLIGDNGARQYFRVDWFTPNGLPTWGDGRLFILGTKGYIELRKYVDVARDAKENHVYIVNGENARYIPASGTVGFPFFGEFILDCLNKTDKAMTQAHIFKAAELCLDAQALADKAR
jgi:predicted dehydrogenase